jgi:hypothetical protein
MTRDEFTLRWRAADSWMLVVLPAARAAGAPPDPAPASGAAPAEPCERLVADGVGAARANDLDRAERSLSAALACPGAAAARELAGVRLLQRRWPEVAALARGAVAADPGDAYAWKLLGTSLFVQDERDAALDAWNRAGEPRLDVVRIDGLDRTRHRVVERLVGTRRGGVLTSDALTRARRRLADLPSALATRLDYAPAPGGLAELRGAVVERPVVPASWLALAAMGVTALGTRELRGTMASPSGGGERIAAAWRFWPHRPRVAVGVAAPAPWGGVWSLDADRERQPFIDPRLADAERTTVRAAVGDWATGAIRWGLHGGVEERANERGLLLGGAGEVSSTRARASLWVDATRWTGQLDFAAANAGLRLRSRAERTGTVLLGALSMHGVTRRTPLDAWPAGDTGHARPTLLRAHPVLRDGRLDGDRLGRGLAAMTAEVQQWLPPRGVLRLAPAAFVDAARTGHRVTGPARSDVDVGVGLRVGFVGVPGILRVDAAKGLRDGATALTVTYDP